MIIQRLGTCNNCNLCSEKRVVVPVRMECGVGRVMETVRMSPSYRKCSIRFKIKSWDLPYPLPEWEIAGIKFLNPISINSADRDTFPKEFTVEMQGTCNKCGFCCGWRNNKATPQCCSHIFQGV